MEESELLEQARKLAYQGRNYEEIKEVVQKSTTNSKAIHNILSSLDQFIVEYQLASQEKAKVLNHAIIGSIFLIIGLGLTGYTLLSGQSQYILAYGAILGGAWALIDGYRKYKQPIEDFIPRKKMFRKNKRY
ncbi:MAG: hypothetical protein ACM3PT_01885 [Deltaproteobacteria bacterium]